MKSILDRFNAALLSMVFALALIAQPALAVPANPPPNQPAYGGPNSIGPNYGGLIGSYSKTMTSGVIAAGASAGAPVYSFQYAGTGLAVIKNVVISVGDAGTGFAAGSATFALYDARPFAVADSGGTAGTLTGNNAKLRTSFSSSSVGSIEIANTGALTPGTRTLDTDPLGAVTFGTPTTAGQALGVATLFSPANAGDYPLVIAPSEGFVVQATVPATGTWIVSVQVVWDEYASY